jgi:hypothetical protein
VAVAERWAGSSGNPTILIDLTIVRVGVHLWTMAARALGVESTPSPQSQVLQAIGLDDYFLLDNCEHIVSAAAEFCATVLRSCPNVRILVTSREPLLLQEEWVHHLAPLDAPEGEASLTAADAIKYSAVELLVERIASTIGGYKLTDHDAPFAAEICRSLGGNPLALELAAAQAEAFNMQQLAEGLKDRFSLLSRGWPSHVELLDNRCGRELGVRSFVPLDSKGLKAFPRCSHVIGNHGNGCVELHDLPHSLSAAQS